jgi:hypothetical protein
MTCPSGYLIAGGGVSSGYEPFTTMFNAPISTAVWQGEIFNTGGGTEPGQVQATCMKLV